MLHFQTMQRKDLAGRAKALNTDSGKLLIQAQDARTTLQGDEMNHVSEG